MLFARSLLQRHFSPDALIHLFPAQQLVFEDDLQEELLRLRKEQFALRMQFASGQLGQVHLMKEVRRDIARVKTIINQKAGE